MQHKLIRKLKIFLKLKDKLANMTIIVEGKRDKTALIQANIGNKDEIIPINSRKIEKIAILLVGKKVAILTDYDRTGEIKAKEVYEELLSQGAEPDLECRKTLRHVLGLCRIEEINTNIRDFEEKLEMIRNKLDKNNSF